MDISSNQSDYLDEDSYVSDDSLDDVSTLDSDLEQDANGVAWREIEKYRERRELESILKDDFYDDLDINNVWE